MKAFKTWLQSPTNTEGAPTEWPWVVEECGSTPEEIAIKIADDFQVLSDSAYAAYLDARDEEYNAWVATKAEEMARLERIKEAKRRIEYGVDVLVRFKEKNIAEGIQWPQGIHLHSRMREWIVTFPTPAQFPHPSYAAIGAIIGGQTRTVDLINILTVCGDIEIAYFCALFGQVDNMTSPLHWASSARITWFMNDMKAFLGWP